MSNIKAKNQESELDFKTVGSEGGLLIRYATIQDEDAEAKINQAFDILFESILNP